MTKSVTKKDDSWISHGKKDEGLYGLKKYRGGSPRFACFSNFQYVLDGKLARGSQPNYLGGDKVHTVTEYDVQLLRQNKISCLISANKCKMQEGGKKLLADANIGFFHFQMEDFTAPNPEQLKTVAKLIEEFRRRGTTIIYCGYGEGRTGTFVAAWALLMYMPSRGLSSAGGGRCSDNFLQQSFGVETAGQKNAVRLAVGLRPVAAATPAAAIPAAAGAAPGLMSAGIGLPDASPPPPPPAASPGVLFPDPITPPPGSAAAASSAGSFFGVGPASGAGSFFGAGPASGAGSFAGAGPAASPAPPPAFAKFSSDSSLSLPPPSPLPPLPAPLPKVPSSGRGSSDMGFPDDDNFGLT